MDDPYLYEINHSKRYKINVKLRLNVNFKETNLKRIKY
jgi:hypothetical protein